MARIRSNEFVDFVRFGKNCRHGALEMKGNEVRSYGVLIAQVDRASRTITFNEHKYSRTTSTHQSAVRGSYSRLGEFRFFPLSF